MIIRETIDMLTNYRNDLIKILRKRLIVTSLIKENPNNEPYYLTPQKTLNILSEIELCNRSIDYLHKWDVLYNGPVIPMDNKEIITQVEQFHW